MDDLTVSVPESMVPVIEQLAKKLGIDPAEIIGEKVPGPAQEKQAGEAGHPVEEFRDAVHGLFGVQLNPEPPQEDKQMIEEAKPKEEPSGDGNSNQP